MKGRIHLFICDLCGERLSIDEPRTGSPNAVATGKGWRTVVVKPVGASDDRASASAVDLCSTCFIVSGLEEHLLAEASS